MGHWRAQGGDAQEPWAWAPHLCTLQSTTRACVMILRRCDTRLWGGVGGEIILKHLIELLAETSITVNIRE